MSLWTELLRHFSRKRVERVEVAYLGLKNAGKKTLLLAAQGQECFPWHWLVHRLSTRDMDIVRIDVGDHDFPNVGRQQNGFHWRQHCPNPSAIVFCVDAADRERLPEAKDELEELLTTDALEMVPILVLGTKTDLPNALSEAELRRELDLPVIRPWMTDDHNALIGLYMCSSSLDTEGYRLGLEWLLDEITRPKIPRPSIRKTTAFAEPKFPIPKWVSRTVSRTKESWRATGHTWREWRSTIFVVVVIFVVLLRGQSR